MGDYVPAFTHVGELYISYSLAEYHIELEIIFTVLRGIYSRTIKQSKDTLEVAMLAVPVDSLEYDVRNNSERATRV